MYVKRAKSPMIKKRISGLEACYHVAPIAVGIDLCGAKGACGVLAEKIYAKSHQYNASDNLDGELVGIDEPGNEAQAETGEQAVHQVAGSGTYPGEKSGACPWYSSVSARQL